MKKWIFLIAVLSFIYTTNTTAQCPQGDKYFQNQAQVDYFAIQCASVDTIHGALIIGDLNSDITDLSGLINLKVILGGLTIQHNDSLRTLQGLDSISVLQGWLTLNDNLSLQSLGHLDGISGIQGAISIQQNDSLEDVNGLQNVRDFDGDLLITENPLLADLRGLSRISLAPAHVRIHDNGGLHNLVGLDSLMMIQGDLTVQNNDSLLSFQGLEQLRFIGHDCSITYNSVLRNLDAFANLDSIKGDLFIGSNDSLSECTGICHLLTGEGLVSGSIAIGDNFTGCLNNADITPYCEALPTIQAEPLALKIYPNPGHQYLDINFAEAIQQVRIFSLAGKPIRFLKIYENKHIDISNLSAGMYILALSTKNTVHYKKIVVE